MLKEFEAWLCGNWVGTISKEQQRTFCSPSDSASPSGFLWGSNGELPLAGLHWICHFFTLSLITVMGLFAPMQPGKPPQMVSRRFFDRGQGWRHKGWAQNCRLTFHEIRWQVMLGYQTQTPFSIFPCSFHLKHLLLTCFGVPGLTLMRP